ncbi:YHS domain-containing protein [Nitratireductor sp. ZSWI3]|uniref:YHS domain-containing protein n=1 Tax=Nitratireductor sp. ZSWI3 TaxID=2966359 RepID=UPI00214FCBE5|nr:YHS domain-containing protein [Nitratireductor sp. ZSWI3]MCR4265908.1 YHS domain-containing protein [Nitratireductor sp. ZSWI3]
MSLLEKFRVRLILKQLIEATIMSTRKIAETYHSRFYGGDTAGARRLLADHSFRFSGPSAEFDDADAFVRASGHAASSVKDVELRKVFADETHACIVFDLVVDHAVGRLPMVEWYRIANGRIAEVHAIFDIAPFMRRQAPAANQAIDPVCGMAVDKAASAARRAHSDTIYYFCSHHCADTFAGNPGRYLARSGK